MNCTSDCRKPSPSQAHCGSCHETFGSVRGFDRHRVGGECLDPAKLKGQHRAENGIWRFDGGQRRADAHSAHRGQPQAAEMGSRVGRDTPGDSEPLETLSDVVSERLDITYEVPVIHCTLAEFRTELWWFENVDPVAVSHGMPDYVGLNIDPGDRDQHLLKDRDGVILLVVRTDRADDA